MPIVRRKKKQKPSRVSTKAQKLANEKLYGNEPELSTVLSQQERAKYLDWCRIMVDLGTAREWLESYLGRRLKRLPDCWLNPTVCYRARMLSRGVLFSEYQKQVFDEALADVLKHENDKAPDTEESLEKPVSIQDRIRERASDVMAELNGLIDDGIPAGFSIEKWYRENQVSPTVVKIISDKLWLQVQQLVEAYEGDCPQLKEAYRFLSRSQLKTLTDQFCIMYDDSQRLLNNEKRAKAPRKKKPVSLEKKLSKLVYLKYSKEFNVTSIDPSRLVGASEVWTLNVKYKLLTVYRAGEVSGFKLDVVGRKVSGFDRNTSKTYRLGRQSSKIVEEVLKSSKSEMKGLVSSLKEAPLQEKIGENTILLKI